MARSMKSAQTGAVRSAARYSEIAIVVKPDPNYVSKFEVYPANQPSREVPVFPAAGSVKPRARTPAPVPLFRTSLRRLVTRKATRGSSNLVRLRRKLLQHASVGADHAMQEFRFGAHAAVGERGIAAGHIDRRHFVCAQERPPA